MREAIRDINQPFSYFKVEETNAPDIVMNIGGFEPQNRDCDVIDHKIYVKNDYIFCTEVLDKVRCSFEMSGIESSPTVVNVWTQGRSLRQKILPSLMAQNIFLRPLIDFKLLQKGIVSIHAAGVSKEGAAIIFSGRGGAHKTTFAMDLIRGKGYRFIGEDRVLLGQNGRVFAYPLHHRLFEYRLNSMATENYGRFDKPKYILYQGRRGKDTNYIQDSADLSSLYSLVKYDGSVIDCLALSKDEIVNKITRSQQMEYLISPRIMKMSSGRMYEYFAAYAYRFPYSKAATYWRDYRDMLHSLLRSKKYCEIYVPKEYNKNVLTGVVNVIENEMEV